MKYSMLVIFVFLFFQLPAQDLPPEIVRKVEDLGEGREQEEFDDDAHWQQLAYFLKHPLDLNHASAEELLSLELLSSLQVEQFMKYRQFLGKLVHLYELQAVPLWDISTIQKLLPYITISEAEPPMKNLFSRFRNGEFQLLGRWSRTLEKLKGFKGSAPPFHGDANSLFLRITYQSGNKLQYGFVAEKDAGEAFFKGAQSAGFDFYSFHFFARKLGKIKALALGDFTVNLGQGLVHWQSMAFGKGMNVINTKREGPVLRPYRSAGEFNFLRGAGITLGFGRTDITGFISSRNISANTSDSTDEFSGFITSGLHRTTSELADRRSIHMITAGGRVSIRNHGWEFGFHSVYYRYSKEIRKRDLPYNSFFNQGRAFLFTGADLSFTYKNLHVFGEMAFDQGLDRAFTGTMLMSADPKLDLVVNFRKISRGYQSLFGNAFTENSLPSNENGFFAGFSLKPGKGIHINAYSDLYSFPWLKYRVDAPTRGADHMISLELLPSRGSSLYIIYRSKAKSLNVRDEQFSFPSPQTRNTLRLHMQKQATALIHLRARMEYCAVSKTSGKEEGFMVLIEPGIKKNRWEGSLRLQFYETQGYDSRIHAWESDVLYANTLSMVYGRGWRWNANFRVKTSRSSSFSIKIARTLRTDGSLLGSGLNETVKPSKTDIRLQFLKKC
jgi:hypothetical protein